MNRGMPEQETELKPVEKPEPAAAQESPAQDAADGKAGSNHSEKPKISEKPTEHIEPLRLEEAKIIEPVARPEPAAIEEPAAAKKEGAAVEKAASPEPAVKPAQAPSAEAAVCREEFEKLKTERDQLLDRLARLQAEFENARKRAERDRAADRDFATASVVEQFLPVVDNFELALKSDGTAEQLRAGVELIVKKMEGVLQQLHVHAIPAVGEEFDPRVHEALGTVERLDLPDHHVAEEIRRGYKIRQRLLRPALVRVVSNPKQKSE